MTEDSLRKLNKELTTSTEWYAEYLLTDAKPITLDGWFSLAELKKIVELCEKWEEANK